MKFSSKVFLSDDKYELTLQIKNKNKERLHLAKWDPTYQKLAARNLH